MKSLLRNSIFILLIVFQPGCRKDTPVIDDDADTSCSDWCQDLPPDGGIGYLYSYEGPQYKSPCFNPINPNEFVYIRSTPGMSTNELVKYDMLSKTESILANSLFINSPPKWSAQGWITFATSQKKIWKVFEDGTQLVQLTNGSQDLHPHFTENGNNICYRRKVSYSNFELQQNPELYKDTKMLFIDLDGNVQDSIMVERLTSDFSGVFSYQIWDIAEFVEDNVYFVGGTEYFYGIYKLDVNTDEISPVSLWSIMHSSLLVNEMDYSIIDNAIYYTKHRVGIIKLSLEEMSQTRLKRSCDTRYYEGMSVSPDGTKMLVERIERELVNTGEVDEQHEIWMIDLNDPCQMEQILGE